MNVLPMQGYMRQQLATAGLRVYDLPPPSPVFPYLTIGIVDGTEDYISDCAVDWEVTGEVHVWAREPGYVAGKQLAVSCYNALGNRHPVFPGFRVGLFALRNQRWLRDPDGLTSHGVLEYRANYGPV
jgi:Protein of unknown function (DUF3168)